MYIIISTVGIRIWYVYARIKLTGILTHIDFGVVGRLSDYRTFLSLKGKRLFHTKNTRLINDDSQENATTISLRLSADSLLLYDI